MRRIIVELSGLALLTSSLCVAACGSGGGSACDALSACCASLGGPEANECSNAISQSGASNAQCATVLSTYPSCKSSGSASGGSAPSNPDGDGEGGIPTDPCASLTTCCPNVPVAGDPMACATVAMDGTAKACLESLETYVSAGYCTGPAEPTFKVGSNEVDGGSGSGGEVDSGGLSGGGLTTCFEVTGTGSEMSCEQVMAPGAECAALAPKATSGACPPTGLYGCCVQPVSSSMGTVITAECVYSERVAMALESNCPAPAHWQTSAP